MAGGAGRGVEHHVPLPPPGRAHVWVTGPPQARGPHPGLLYRWESRPGLGWFALVVYLVQEDDALVQQWVPASRLSPVAGLPATRTTRRRGRRPA